MLLERNSMAIYAIPNSTQQEIFLFLVLNPIQHSLDLQLQSFSCTPILYMFFIIFSSPKVPSIQQIYCPSRSKDLFTVSWTRYIFDLLKYLWGNTLLLFYYKITKVLAIKFLLYWACYFNPSSIINEFTFIRCFFPLQIS